MHNFKVGPRSRDESWVLSKFTQNPCLGDLMRNTGDTVLAESSAFDTYSGTRVSLEDTNAFDQRSWRGTNRLGLLLNEVRDMIKSLNCAVFSIWFFFLSTGQIWYIIVPPRKDALFAQFIFLIFVSHWTFRYFPNLKCTYIYVCVFKPNNWFLLHAACWYILGIIEFDVWRCALEPRPNLLWYSPCQPLKRSKFNKPVINRVGGGWIRLIVGFQPLMVTSTTASCIRWCMQVYAWWF